MPNVKMMSHNNYYTWPKPINFPARSQVLVSLDLDLNWLVYKVHVIIKHSNKQYNVYSIILDIFYYVIIIPTLTPVKTTEYLVYTCLCTYNNKQHSTDIWVVITIMLMVCLLYYL